MSAIGRAAPGKALSTAVAPVQPAAVKAPVAAAAPRGHAATDTFERPAVATLRLPSALNAAPRALVAPAWSALKPLPQAAMPRAAVASAQPPKTAPVTENARPSQDAFQRAGVEANFKGTLNQRGTPGALDAKAGAFGGRLAPPSATATDGKLSDAGFGLDTFGKDGRGAAGPDPLALPSDTGGQRRALGDVGSDSAGLGGVGVGVGVIFSFDDGVKATPGVLGAAHVDGQTYSGIGGYDVEAGEIRGGGVGGSGPGGSQPIEPPPGGAPDNSKSTAEQTAAAEALAKVDQALRTAQEKAEADAKAKAAAPAPAPASTPAPAPPPPSEHDKSTDQTPAMPGGIARTPDVGPDSSALRRALIDNQGVAAELQGNGPSRARASRPGPETESPSGAPAPRTNPVADPYGAVTARNDARAATLMGMNGLADPHATYVNPESEARPAGGAPSRQPIPRPAAAKD